MSMGRVECVSEECVIAGCVLLVGAVGGVFGDCLCGASLRALE